MDNARLRSITGKFHSGRRHGEIKHTVGGGKHRQRIIGDGNANRPDTGDLACITPEHGRTLALNRTGHCHAACSMNGANQRLPHAPCRANHNQPHVRHARQPSMLLSGFP